MLQNVFTGVNQSIFFWVLIVQQTWAIGHDVRNELELCRSLYCDPLDQDRCIPEHSKPIEAIIKEIHSEDS